MIKEDYSRGGLGKISLVYDLNSDTYMIVKKTKSLTIEDYEYLKQEAFAWLILDKHPNIATFFYYRENSEGIPLLYSEFIDGGNLREWINNELYEMQIEKILLIIFSIALQISSAMYHAHNQNVYHLDLRLDNICVFKKKINHDYPHIALIDFGIYIKNKEDRNELLKIINSNYFKKYRTGISNNKWSPNKDINIHYFIECDIKSFSEGLKEIIEAFGIKISKFTTELQKFANISSSNDYKSKITRIISLIEKEVKFEYKHFSQILIDLEEIYKRMNNGNSYEYLPIDNQHKEADLVNKSISYLHLDNSQINSTIAKKLLEKSFEIQKTHHIYSSYNYEILKWNQLNRSKNTDVINELINFPRRIPPEYKFIPDKKKYYYEHYRNLAYKIIYRLLQTKILISIGDLDKALQHLSDVDIQRKFIMLENDSFIRAKYYDLRGIIYLFKFNYGKAEYNFTEAEKLISNYWLYKVHLALSKIKNDNLDKPNREIHNLLIQAIKYGESDINQLLNKNENKDNRHKVLMEDLWIYLKRLKLNIKEITKFETKLLPSVNFIFDMSNSNID